MISDVPTVATRCPFVASGQRVQLQTRGPAQLDSALFASNGPTLVTGFILNQDGPNAPSRVQSFALDGSATNMEETAFSASGPIQPQRVSLARGTAGYSIAGLVGLGTQAELARESLQFRHVRSALNDDGALVHAITTPDQKVQVLTVTNGAQQRFRVHTLADDGQTVTRTFEHVYPNAAGPSIAIAPANSQNVVVTWAEGIVGPVGRIHAMRLTAQGAEPDQVIDSIPDQPQRPTVYAAGGSAGAWVFWTDLNRQLWGALLPANEQVFRPRVMITQTVAASEAAAAIEHNGQILFFTKGLGRNRDNLVELKLFVLDAQSGQIAQEIAVDEMEGPFRFAIARQNSGSFTLAWTATVNPMGDDTRIFIRTYEPRCQ